MYKLPVFGTYFGYQNETGGDTYEIFKSEQEQNHCIAVHAGSGNSDRTDLLVQQREQYRQRYKKELADEVLRFHVLANSDSTLDQEMKLCVRNEILEFLQTEMPTGAGAEATKEWVRSHCDEIEQTAEKCLTEKGYDDPVNAAVTTTYFERRYQI